MDAIQTLAAIFGIVVVTKMLTLWFAPKVITDLGKCLMKRIQGYRTVVTVGTLVVGYYILREVPIEVVAAVSLFVAGLYGMTLLSYESEMKELMKGLTRKPKTMVSRAMIPFAIWFAIGAWTLWSIFG